MGRPRRVESFAVAARTLGTALGDGGVNPRTFNATAFTLPWSASTAVIKLVESGGTAGFSIATLWGSTDGTTYHALGSTGYANLGETIMSPPIAVTGFAYFYIEYGGYNPVVGGNGVLHVTVTATVYFSDAAQPMTPRPFVYPLIPVATLMANVAVGFLPITLPAAYAYLQLVSRTTGYVSGAGQWVLNNYVRIFPAALSLNVLALPSSNSYAQLNYVGSSLEALSFEISFSVAPVFSLQAAVIVGFR